ncbi:uncharacterized protein LOC135708094 [Ochlerotatus camptorhynchus]|uniref:uncharacterized protein LOC135708094 n=1 Tax=Ochlerotatus camptorhynchus TaxID=644619 RepID=UPI0031D736D2
MALFLARRARHVCPKTVPKVSLRVRFSTAADGSGDDGNQKAQSQLNRLHTYETVDDPNSLVKTTIIRRNPVLQRAKTPEEILEHAANAVAKKKPEQEIKDKTALLKSGLSDETDGARKDFEKNVYWGHDGKKSIVGYDIFQELEERLEEILSRNEDLANSLENKKEEKKDTEKSNEKLAKISTALEGISRLLSFYLLRSYLYQKHW